MIIGFRQSLNKVNTMNEPIPNTTSRRSKASVSSNVRMRNPLPHSAFGDQSVNTCHHQDLKG